MEGTKMLLLLQPRKEHVGLTMEKAFVGWLGAASRFVPPEASDLARGEGLKTAISLGFLQFSPMKWIFSPQARREVLKTAISLGFRPFPRIKWIFPPSMPEKSRFHWDFYNFLL